MGEIWSPFILIPHSSTMSCNNALRKGNGMHFHYLKCKVVWDLNSEYAYHFLFPYHYYAHSHSRSKSRKKAWLTSAKLSLLLVWLRLYNRKYHVKTEEYSSIVGVIPFDTDYIEYNLWRQQSTIRRLRWSVASQAFFWYNNDWDLTTCFTMVCLRLPWGSIKADTPLQVYTPVKHLSKLHHYPALLKRI